MTNDLLRDPIEDDPSLRAIFAAVDVQAQAELERKHGENLYMLLGQWFERDLIKQKILLKEHGIRWRTTSEMNPDVCFD